MARSATFSRATNSLLADIENSPLADSFNPVCRLGLTRPRWADNPRVQFVELDFVSGSVNPCPVFRGQLWGGLALGCLLPVACQHPFEVTGRAEFTINRTKRFLFFNKPADKLHVR